MFNVTRRVFDIDQFYISLECFRFDGENCDDLRKNYRRSSAIYLEITGRIRDHCRERSDSFENVAFFPAMFFPRGRRLVVVVVVVVPCILAFPFQDYMQLPEGGQ